MSNHLFTFILPGEAANDFGRSAVPRHQNIFYVFSATKRFWKQLSGGSRISCRGNASLSSTNAAQVEAVRKELPFLPGENVVAEPEKRDTAPACAWLSASPSSRQGSHLRVTRGRRHP